MRKIEVNILDSLFGRLEGISKVLGVDFNKVINVVLIQGLPEYWHKICEICRELENQSFSSSKKDNKWVTDNFKIIANNIKKKYENMKTFDLVEKDFQEVFKPDDFINSVEGWRAFKKALGI